MHVVDYYLDEQQATAQKEVIRLARSVSSENDEMLLNYAFEALRKSNACILVIVWCFKHCMEQGLNPPVSSVVRKDESGQPFILNVTNANLDVSVSLSL